LVLINFYNIYIIKFYLILWRDRPQWAKTSSLSGLYDHTHSVGLLWTSNRTVAETSSWQKQHSKQTYVYAPGGIRTRIPNKRSAADPRLRPRSR